MIMTQLKRLNLSLQWIQKAFCCPQCLLIVSNQQHLAVFDYLQRAGVYLSEKPYKKSLSPYIPSWWMCPTYWNQRQLWFSFCSAQIKHYIRDTLNVAVVMTISVFCWDLQSKLMFLSSLQIQYTCSWVLKIIKSLLCIFSSLLAVQSHAFSVNKWITSYCETGDSL